MKTYSKPTTKVVKIQQKFCILDASVEGNSGLRYGGRGSGPARARSNSNNGTDWDSWEE